MMIVSRDSYTHFMIEKTRQCLKGNWLSRSVAARGMGVGCAMVSVIDAVRQGILGILLAAYAISNRSCELVRAGFGLTGRVNPLNIQHAMGRDVRERFRQAGIHALIGLSWPVALLSPSRVLPVEKDSLFHRVQQAAKIGLLVIGIASAANKLGVFSWFRREKGYFDDFGLPEIGVFTVVQVLWTAYYFRWDKLCRAQPKVQELDLSHLDWTIEK